MFAHTYLASFNDALASDNVAEWVHDNVDVIRNVLTTLSYEDGTIIFDDGSRIAWNQTKPAWLDEYTIFEAIGGEFRDLADAGVGWATASEALDDLREVAEYDGNLRFYKTPSGTWADGADRTFLVGKRHDGLFS